MNETPERNIQDDKNPRSVFQKKKKKKFQIHVQSVSKRGTIPNIWRNIHAFMEQSAVLLCDFIAGGGGGGRLCSSREERAPLEAGNRIGRVKLSKFPIGGPEIPRPLIDLTDRIRPTLAILLGVIAWKRGCRLFFPFLFFSPLSREKNPLLCVRISRFYIGRTGVTASGRNAIEARRMEASLQSCPRLFNRRWRGLAGFVFEEILIERNRAGIFQFRCWCNFRIHLSLRYRVIYDGMRYYGFSRCVKSEVPSCILPCNWELSRKRYGCYVCVEKIRRLDK